MIKHLLFISHSPDMYGAEKVLFNIISHFSLSGDRVSVLLPQKGLFYERLSELKPVKKYVRFYPNLTKNFPGAFIYLLMFPFALINLILFIKKINPDIVYINTRPNLIPALAAFLSGKKTVWHAHEVNYGGFWGKIFARCFGFCSDKVIFVSRYAGDTYLNVNPKLRDKSMVIYNGIQFNPRDCLAEVPQEMQRLKTKFPGRLIVGTMGNLSPGKRIADFIKAAKIILEQYENVIFIILGAGRLLRELKSLAGELGIEDRVCFLGFQKNVYPIINLTDIMVFPYEKDAFPLSVLEALALKKPVVVADRGGLLEIVEHGSTGRIFPVGDTGQLAEQVLTLLKDAGLRATLGEDGFKRYEEMFTIEKQLSSIGEVMESLA